MALLALIVACAALAVSAAAASFVWLSARADKERRRRAIAGLADVNPGFAERMGGDPFVGPYIRDALDR